MIEGIASRSFCLDRSHTEESNNIKIGKGYLVLGQDKTFTVINEDPMYSNVKGKWDLCCWGSDYGNYVFKVDGLPEWKQASPDFWVLINGKKIRLFFKLCY